MSILSQPTTHERHGLNSPFWKGRRKSFIGPIGGALFICLITFIANLSYIYGSMFQTEKRVPALKVLALDYDGSSVGEAMEDAYQSLSHSSFPTLEYGSTSDYPNTESIREAVCKKGYWGVVWSQSDATSKLVSAVNGSSNQIYDPTTAIQCMYSGVYYPVVEASYIQSNLQTLIAAAGSIIYSVTGSDVLLSSVNLTNPTSATAFLNPISSSGCTVLFPTEQGIRALLNTVTLIVGPLMQFFFLMGMNNIAGGCGMLSGMRIRDVYLFRLVVSKVYTFLGGLVITGCIWAFREGWVISSGGKFMETWMCLWFFLDINYLIIDTVLVTIIPMAGFPFFFFTWVFLNVTGTIWPFELSPGFYRWAWATPAHDTWILLMGIWSGGCRLDEDVVLPVLFVWWFVGHFASAWSVWRRCMMSDEAEEEGIPDPDMLPVQPHRSHSTIAGGTRSNRQSIIGRIHSFASRSSRAGARSSELELAMQQKGKNLNNAGDMNKDDERSV